MAADIVVALVVIDAVGVVYSLPITVDAVEVQPLEPVTITVYVPAAVTVLVDAVLLSSHI